MTVNTNECTCVYYKAKLYTFHSLPTFYISITRRRGDEATEEERGINGGRKGRKGRRDEGTKGGRKGGREEGRKGGREEGWTDERREINLQCFLYMEWLYISAILLVLKSPVLTSSYSFETRHVSEVGMRDEHGNIDGEAEKCRGWLDEREAKDNRDERMKEITWMKG